MIRRLAVIGGLIAVSVCTVAPGAAGAAPAEGEVTDPELLERIEVVEERRERTGDPRVPNLAVEVLTDVDGAVRQRIIELGGVVTGSVPGGVVQGSVPLTRIDDLAATAGVESVQAPRIANRRPVAVESMTAEGFGGFGEQVALTNANGWHAAGIEGAGMNVGIVDYFSMEEWDPTEHGPQPTAANGRLFCRDTSGLAPQMCTIGGDIANGQGDPHGVAVAEIVLDMAPQATLYLAQVATVSDLRAAIDWFAANGVRIMTRSLGSAYDGPGDGTGPLGSAVDYAVSQGITWFNSAGNDAVDQYKNITVSTTPGGFVDFDEGPGVDTMLRLDAPCIWFDGVRWSTDWYLPPSQRTDYSIEVYEPIHVLVIGGHYTNPALQHLNHLGTIDANQRAGAVPLEAADLRYCPNEGISYIRIKRNAATPIGSTPDKIEIAVTGTQMERYYGEVAGSAAKPVVDSKNAGLVAVGATDLGRYRGTTHARPYEPPMYPEVAEYSSQGPTTDGRIKPDVVAPACFSSTVYRGCFAGTSAAAPGAAGIAALLASQGLALTAQALGALVRSTTIDLGAPGPDNAFGSGMVQLPPPPAPLSTNLTTYQPLSPPQRLLDTRPELYVGQPHLAGPHAPFSLLDVKVTGIAGVPGSGVTAVAVNITSVNAVMTSYIQALPTLLAPVGATSTLNISNVTSPRPNFAIVPVGEGGQISLYLPAGGNIVIDVLGYFSDAPAASVAGGRFVSVDPERWLDSRDADLLPAGFAAPRRVNSFETVQVRPLAGSAVNGPKVRALVLSVVATNASGNGFVRALPTGAAGLQYSTTNYVPGNASSNTVIMPVGADGTVSMYVSTTADLVVDVVGYITNDSAPVSNAGLYRAITPGRNYDSRLPGPAPFASGEARAIQLTGLAAPAAVVPAGAAAVSANLAVVSTGSEGFLTVFPSTQPATSNLNYPGGSIVASASLLKLNPAGAVIAMMSQLGHVIIDINGYFTGPS